MKSTHTTGNTSQKVLLDLPALYGRTKMGGKKYWKIKVVKQGTQINVVTEFGVIRKGSKEKLPEKLQTTSEVVKTGKNLGRANATTKEEQAKNQARSAWQKKIDSDYVEDIEKIDSPNIIFKPMLAKVLEDAGPWLKENEPIIVQPKMDGIRCIAIKDSGSIRLYSRKGKEITSMNHIVNELEQYMKNGDILDGELYIPNSSFNDIASKVRKQSMDEGSNLIEYWVFDKPSDISPYRDRFIARVHFRKGNIIKTPTTLIPYTAKGLELVHNTMVARGFEGLILRPNDDSPYENSRSQNLVKYKKFQDEEFEIVDVEEGKGKLAGHLATFIMKLNNGETFRGKMDGPLSELKKMWKNRQSYIGKIATVCFQAYTPAGVPRFPVVKSIRDYE